MSVRGFAKKFMLFFLKPFHINKDTRLQKAHGLTKIYYKSLSISSHGKGYFSTGKSIIFALDVGSITASYKSILLYKGHFFDVSTRFY